MNRFDLHEFTRTWQQVHGLDWEPTALHARILRRLWTRFVTLMFANNAQPTMETFALWLLTTNGHQAWQTQYDQETGV